MKTNSCIIDRMDRISEFLQQPHISDFVTIFMGIVVEAFPFVVLGTIVSVIFGVFVGDEYIYRFLPKNRVASHIMLSLSGIFMPVCECRNVPVVRRFMQKGLGLSHAITFLLAAPILNPITLWSTAEAFNFDHRVVVIRAVGAFVIANMIGLIFSYSKDQKIYLTEEFEHEYCAHDHSHSDSKFRKSIDIFLEEFMNIMKMMIFGAAIAAAIQVFLQEMLSLPLVKIRGFQSLL